MAPPHEFLAWDDGEGLNKRWGRNPRRDSNLFRVEAPAISKIRALIVAQAHRGAVRLIRFKGFPRTLWGLEVMVRVHNSRYFFAHAIHRERAEASGKT
jgi:hypothetical protein